MFSRYHCFAFNVASCSLTFLFCITGKTSQNTASRAPAASPAGKEHSWGQQRTAPNAELLQSGQISWLCIEQISTSEQRIWTKNLNGQLPFVGCGWQNDVCLCRHRFLALYGNVTFIFIKPVFGNTSAPNALHFKHFSKVLHKKVISPKIHSLSWSCSPSFSNVTSTWSPFTLSHYICNSTLSVSSSPPTTLIFPSTPITNHQPSRLQPSAKPVVLMLTQSSTP